MYMTVQTTQRPAFWLWLAVVAILAAMPAMAQLTVAPTNVSLTVGGTQQFTATPAAGVLWTATGTGVANGNTISVTGLFTAGTTPGTYRVSATSINGTASADVTVTGMTLTPATVSMSPGQTQVFAVLPAAAAVTWSTTGTGNTVSNAGLFTAGLSSGTFTVTATSTLYGSATATVTIAALVISPATVAVNTGATQQFTATPNTNVTWSVSVGGGAISTNGLYTAPNTAGTYTITAIRPNGNGGNDTATATVTVAVALAVAPATTTLSIGNTQQFAVTPATPGTTWALAPASTNTISAAGLFTAATAGNYTLTAITPGGQTATAAITVTALVVTPATATVARGATQDFNANPAAGVTWTVTPAGQGVTIDGNSGLVTVTATATIGTYTVTATSTANGIATAILNVGGSGTIVVTPSAAQVLPSGTQQFTANPGAGVTWSAVGGGTISNGGLYTAPATVPAGPVTITATSTSGTGTATVTVASLIVAPATVSLKPGGTQLFVATPATGVTWTVSTGGGTISATGLYTAPSTPGAYTVTATSAAGTATATVNVTSLLLSPPSATILTEGTVQFTATPNTSVTWSVSGGGTIDNAGKFTAGTTPGTFTVTATSTNGTATATVEVKNPPLTITPLAAMVQPNGTQQFDVDPTGTAVTWTVSGGGTISNAGLFTANANNGQYTVTAKSATETATATVYVTPLTVSPAYVTLRPSATQQFNANPAAGVVWTATGGTITAGGNYTAPATTGTYKVTAFSPTLNWETTATVVVAEAGLLIDPAAVTMAPGDAQQFTATPADGVVWTCTGGTIDNTGVFKAGDVAGTFTVTANSAYGTATAAVTISVTANVPGYEAVPDAYSSLLNPVGRAGVGTLRSLVGETINAVGSWHFGSTGGDPLVPADDNFSLVDRVLAYLYIGGDTTEFEVGAAGKVLVQPYKDDVQQRAGFTWSTDDPLRNFTVQFTLSLVRDVLQWEYRITNNNRTTKRAGFRLNAFVKYLGQTGDRYTLPDGNTYNSVREYAGAGVPDSWSVRYTPGVLPTADKKPVLRAEQLLRRNDVGPTAGPAPTTPARLVFASEEALQSYTWPYIEQPVGDSPIVPDTAFEDTDGTPSFAVGTYYFNDLLLPGEANAWVVSGEYRYGWSAVETSDHYAVAQAGTEWLNWRTGDNPATQTVEAGFYEPADATIRAYLCNSSKMAGTARVTATITPGTGLSLAPGQSATYQNISVGEMQDLLLRRSAADQYSWKLVPNGMASGLIPVTVEAKFSPGGNVVTSVFYVNVPAAPQAYFERGVHFTGFPFEFADPDPRVALGLGNMVEVAWYDPVLRRFKQTDAGDRVPLYPGEGYWLNLHGNVNITLRDATPISQKDSYSIDLSAGWNAVANPFQYGIDWAKCKIYYQDQRYTMSEAIAAGLVGSYLWTWDPHSSEYRPPQNSSPSEGLGQALQPYVGYWLYAYETVGLIYTPNPFVPAMVRGANASKTRGVGRADSWQVNIVAQTAAARDAINTFGVQPDGAGRGNVLEPPLGVGGLSASFVQAGTRGPENYAVALAAPGGVIRWTMDVQCATANEAVTLTWPDLTQAPAETNLVLVDELTGKQIAMRGCPSYTFNSGAGGVRRFAVVAGGAVQKLQITRAMATGGTGRAPVTFTVDTSAASTVSVRVRTLTGTLVRELAAPAVGASTSVMWDGLSAQGKRVTPGLYSCEIYAEAPDGQRVRSVVTVHIR